MCCESELKEFDAQTLQKMHDTFLDLSIFMLTVQKLKDENLDSATINHVIKEQFGHNAIHVFTKLYAMKNELQLQ